MRAATDGLAVEFVDPDADAAEPDPAEQPPDAHLTLEALALDGHGTHAELMFLERAYTELRERIHGDEWQGSKQAKLAAMSQPAFWESPERFAIMGAAEYMDRLEAGLRTAGSLLRRLKTPSSNGRRRIPRELVERLAEQLYLVTAARETFDEGLPLGVSGFGAYAILASGGGLHVLEEPSAAGPVRRVRVNVRVVGQPEGQPVGDDGVVAAAERALADSEASNNRIVRRYRELPSPLVRDSVRGWRSGRIDLVLGGDFDLVGA